jgi:hypothetical protein
MRTELLYLLTVSQFHTDPKPLFILEGDFFPMFGVLECIDRRDKVYGLSGLIDAREHSIVIDYDKTVYEVYADLLVSLHSAYLSICDKGRPPKTQFLRRLERLFTEMDGQEAHRSSLRQFLRAIFNEERTISFCGRSSPITAIGFDHASENIPEDRWWYDSLGKRYYVECNSSEWTLEHHRPLLVDWEEYLPLDEDERIAILGAPSPQAQQ